MASTQVIPLQLGLCPVPEQTFYLKFINRLLLVIAPSHIELWNSSQFFILFYFIQTFGFVVAFFIFLL
uniref:Uncharacterized protein n=1 Tax=Nelumbo nucifera TaxID=4432 RepID=A0A822XJM1_NELNU|nr:TPA_asm: hypothetical protein HUJ06_020458 [Nelumbo nucifera]